MKSIILAGGSGTRLWPLSRKNYPKQFLRINGENSLLRQTYNRLREVVSPDDIIIITNNDYKFYVLSDLCDPAGGKLQAKTDNLILEPAPRNTAPAIALGISFCLEKLGCSGDEVIFVCPSDHIVNPADRFSGYLLHSENIAREGRIVTFGIKPTRPETGYGYIKTTNRQQSSDGTEYFNVERFIEKPDSVNAAKYFDAGNYYWNSGMFAFTISVMLSELEEHAPEIRKLIDLGFDAMLSDFANLPDISIDYAMAEKSDKVVTLPLDIYWNDIGSWDSLYDALEKDRDGNVVIGDALAIDTHNTLLLGNKRFISTIGINDCIIVETEDALLIANKGKTQRVREIVENLRKTNRKESEEHLTTYRPWGNYTVLEEGPRYKIKRIVVNAGERLSLQKHYHRSEHWVVVKGTAKVTIGGKDIFIHENESAYVPKSTLHRLENPGKVPLEIIEVQNGEYVGEDDIVRVDDAYGR